MAAAAAGESDPAFENFRTAAELAGKGLLLSRNIQYDRTHNVSSALVVAGLWPRERGRELSRLLDSFTRSVYRFDDPVGVLDLKSSERIADDLVRLCETVAEP